MKKDQNTVEDYELFAFALTLGFTSFQLDKILEGWYPEYGPIIVTRADVLGDREGDLLKILINFLDYHKVDKFIILPKLC